MSLFSDRVSSRTGRGSRPIIARDKERSSDLESQPDTHAFDTDLFFAFALELRVPETPTFDDARCASV
jgi:hypothetical protein